MKKLKLKEEGKRLNHPAFVQTLTGFVQQIALIVG
jgi:hypothetical protein